MSEHFDRFIDQPWRKGAPPSWSLAFLAHPYRSYWERRDRSEVLRIHFANLQQDLAAQTSRLANFLGAPIDPARARALAAEAHIDRARGRALDLAPEAHMGFWRDPAAFFRNGASGEWRRVMSPEQQRRYLQRAGERFEPELSDWVHGAQVRSIHRGPGGFIHRRIGRASRFCSGSRRGLHPVFGPMYAMPRLYRKTRGLVPWQETSAERHAFLRRTVSEGPATEAGDRSLARPGKEHGWGIRRL